MRLFVEDLKGYVVAFENVKKVLIAKKENKNVLLIEYLNEQDNDVLLLKDVKLAFMVDTKTLCEYFRYCKGDVR